MEGPLSGVRIIDMTSVVMGPVATQILGDMGADVVKIEPETGDIFRYVMPAQNKGMGAHFLNMNRNKRSVQLNLKLKNDLNKLNLLISKADILIFNLRPKSMRKLGLDYEALAAINPHLIYCGAYGFSEDGPYAGRPALDDMIQALSGMAAIQQGNGNRPGYVNSILADKVTALVVVYSVSMALFERERSGLGQAIEVPMFETMAAFNLLEHMSGHTFNPPKGQMGYDRLLSEQRRPYKTSDGFLAVMPYTNNQWKSFFSLCNSLPANVEQLYEDPEQRSLNIDKLYKLLAEQLSTRSTKEWLALLEKTDIPYGRVNSMYELLDDPHLNKVGMFEQRTHPTEGNITIVNPSVSFSRTKAKVRTLAPNLGEHNLEEILTEWQVPNGSNHDS